MFSFGRKNNSPNRKESLESAVKQGRVDSVKRLLDQPLTEEQARDAEDYTTLMTACKNPDSCTPEMLSALLSDGRAKSTLNQPSQPRVGTYAILLACQCAGQYEVVQLLVDRSADITIRDLYGNNALHYLARNRNASTRDRSLMVQIAMNKGVRFDLANKKGLYPTHIDYRIGAGITNVLMIDYEEIMRLMFEQTFSETRLYETLLKTWQASNGRMRRKMEVYDLQLLLFQTTVYFAQTMDRNFRAPMLDNDTIVYMNERLRPFVGTEDREVTLNEFARFFNYCLDQLNELQSQMQQLP